MAGLTSQLSTAGFPWSVSPFSAALVTNISKGSSITKKGTGRDFSTRGAKTDLLLRYNYNFESGFLPKTEK